MTAVSARSRGKARGVELCGMEWFDDPVAMARDAEADVVVFAISDLEAVRRAIRLARELNPKVRIIVRTRQVQEIEALHREGADEVIAQEFETSIEIFTRVLEHYHIPRNVIRAETRALRGGGYQMMRSPASPIPGSAMYTASVKPTPLNGSAGSSNTRLLVRKKPPDRSIAATLAMAKGASRIQKAVREDFEVSEPQW
mgnify:CR=1 FL=1